MALKFITLIRPSGTFIELQNTKEMKAYAKANGWKIKKDQPTPELTGDEDGNSGPSSESDTSGDTSTGDGS